jgi:hypothetical protein
MFYTEYNSCLSNKAKILLKEKNDKFMAFVPIIKLIEMLQVPKKEYYTLDQNSHLHRVKGIEFIGMQEFFELQTFSGSTILLGHDTEILIDTFWLKARELEYHEKIWEYNFLMGNFEETFITKFEYIGIEKAYQVYSEKNTGMIIDNLLIRFDNEEQIKLDLYPKI